MQFNYFAGRTVTSTWSDWITGKADGILSLSYSETNKPAGLAELESALLALLKKGELKNPTYLRDPADENGYFKYNANRITANHPYFYTYMDELNYDLDWQYLVDIANANGYTNFTYDDYLANPQMPDLIQKLKDGELVNPYYANKEVPEFYQAYTGKKTDFFAAMEELGYEITWDQFAKIAYKNREAIDPNTENITINTRLLTVVNGLRNISDAGYYTLSPYAYFYNPDGLNWWAEAIKGKTTELYPVINKYAYNNSTERPFAYYGDVRNNFSGETTKNLPLDGQNYIGGFRGLDADIYSVSFSIANEYEISAEEANTVMRHIATGPSYFFAANTQEGLTSALKAIASTVSSGASRAWYTDTMGPEFDLSTTKTVKVDDKEITVNAEPTIRVLEYKLDENGKRVGDPIVREVVKFESIPTGGTEELKAWSNQVYDIDNTDGIIKNVYTERLGEDGIIRAKYFYYNTNKYVDENNTGAVPIDLTGDNVADYSLPAETFLWIIGVLGETEMVLDYQVYLTGSMEATREAGLYDTNTHAELSYNNYLGNPCVQEVPTPKYPWDQGSVGYAFYLVDRDGNPIVNQETGATGSFELSVELTDIIYDTFNLDGTPHTITAKEVMDELVESGKMPAGYALYDPTAQYTVTVNPNVAPGDPNGTYKVESGVTRPTTWISGLEYDDKLPATGEVHNVYNAETANTTVWFAVYIDVQTYPDAVVIDYGIPVDIHVMGNDSNMPAKYAELAAIGAYRDAGYTENLADKFGKTYHGTYGTAKILNTDASDVVIRYTLNTENGMQMSNAEKFTYAVKYTGPYRANGYYYETITIIPAANIYYEDNYLNFTDSTSAAEGLGVWYDGSSIAVSCHNTGAWDEVYAYCKDASGPAGTWPGVKMVDNDHDNIYTAYVPADQLGKAVMFNDGDKAYQTADITIAGDGAVYTLDGKWTVYTAKDTSIKTVYFQNDQNWSTVNAYCWGDNGEWKVWPGTGMKYDSEKGQYFIEVPADMTSIIFNNGEGTQTGTMEVRDEHVYRTDGYVTGPVKTVYFQNDQNWSTVNAYWWNGTTNNGWPGLAITIDETTGLYSASVPADMTGIIFSDGNGTQTNDLAVADRLVYKPDSTYTSLDGNETERTVYFNTEGGPLCEVYAYCWNYSGEALEPWPGTKMTFDKTTGLYSINVPADMTYIIFNNNNDGEKGSNLGWFTIEESGKIYRRDRWEYRVLGNDVFFDNTSSGWAEVYAYYWSYGDTGMTSWPGEKMTLGENGLYHLTIPVNAENIVFSNGSSQKQTSDIKIGASGTIYYPDGTMANNNAAPRTYYYSGDNWDQVYAYAWSEKTGDKNKEWPGEQMTYDEDTGLYSITIKNGAFDRIIFTNNQGEQTANLVIPAPESIYHGDDDYEGDPIIQAEDRPGADEALKSIDANNVYGYDPAYTNYTTHSLDSVRHVTVNAATGKSNNAPSATFTFTGTGFDVVGLTNSDSGAIWVQVNDQGGNPVKSYVVNTYYGYDYKLCKVVYTKLDGKWKLTHVEEAPTGAKEQIAVKPDDAANGTKVEGIEYAWIVNPGVSDSLYQVPVIKVTGLQHNTYTVTMKVIYLASMDMDLEDDDFVEVNGQKVSTGSYTVWLDAIRIYDPIDTTDSTEDSTIAKDAYEQDGESNPHYVNVKDLLVGSGSFTAGTTNNGVVYVDGKSTGVTIDEYNNQGPNNETYLKNGNAIAFKLRYQGTKAPSINLQIGAKLAKGTSVTLNLNGQPLTELATATNMFYKLGNLNWTKDGNYYVSDPIVLSCSADASSILSLTDLKITGSDAAAIEEMPATSTAGTLSLVCDEDVVETARKYLASSASESEQFEINLAQAELGNALNLYFLFPADSYADWTGCYAVVTKTYADGRDDVTVTVPASEWDEKISGGKTLKRVGFHAIAAKEMGDAISITVYNANGEAISTPYSDSIVKYLTRMLEKNTDPEFRCLAVDMLIYGSAAQLQFHYNEENLAYDGLTNEQMLYGSVMLDPIFTDVRVKTETVRGTSVSLENNIVMNVFFVDQTADMTATVTFVNHNGDTINEKLTSTESKNGYCFVVDQLAVADARSVLVTVTCYDADGNVYGSVTDSVESYFARNSTSSGLDSAIVLLADSAYEYLH